jgi:hypothetical protein
LNDEPGTFEPESAKGGQAFEPESAFNGKQGKYHFL